MGVIYSRGWPDRIPTRPEKEPATRSLERYWEREYDVIELLEGSGCMNGLAWAILMWKSLRRIKNMI